MESRGEQVALLNRDNPTGGRPGGDAPHNPYAGTDVFDLRGIDRTQGCLVVVRPDQYVAHVLPLDGHEALAGFFAGVMDATVVHHRPGVPVPAIGEK